MTQRCPIWRSERVARCRGADSGNNKHCVREMQLQRIVHSGNVENRTVLATTREQPHARHTRGRWLLWLLAVLATL